MLQHEFPEKLREMLSRASQDIPDHLDLFPRIHQPLQSEQPRQLPRPGLFGQKKSRLLAVAILVVLLISGFAYAIPPVFQWLGDQSLQTITLSNATAINQQTTSHGITLQLDQAYADGARTAVTFHVTSSSSLQAVPDDRVLVDATGQMYRLIDGRQYKHEGLVEFFPFSTQQLGHSQSVTFVVHQMWLTGYNTHGHLVAGNWKITFSIIPRAGHLLSLRIAPSTHAAITLRPTLIEQAPSGLHLFIQISGLAPDISLNTLTQFATRQVYSGNTPDGLGIGTGVLGEGALLQMQLSNGQVLEPVRVDVQEPTSTLQIPDHPVGATGTTTLDVLFLTSLSDTQAVAMLTIDHLHIALVGGANSQQANGPWTFSIPLL